MQTFRSMGISYGVVVHEGAESPPQFTDGCKVACESAFALLGSGSSLLDATVEAVRFLEDDGSGFSPMMLGRVGDSPMIGCGFYADSECAIATTGMGEEIIKKMFARTIYELMSDDGDVKKACEKGIKLFPLM